ncbi:MAG: hypothetical protein ABI639_10155 [Thermoanaerobaculia bacterium]
MRLRLRFRPILVASIGAMLALVPLAGLHAVDGTLDTSFWTDGKVYFSPAGSYQVEKVLIAPDGYRVVVGTVDDPGTGEQWFWKRIGDASAGTTCLFFPPGGATQGRGLAAQFDGAGRLVVAGSARYGSDRLAVARFSYPDCMLDDNFDGDGFYTLDLPGGSEEIQAMEISPIGILTFGGYLHTALGNDMVVLQLTDNGAPVSGFSGNGWLTLDVSGAQLDDAVKGIAVDAQNRVVIGGSTAYGASGDNADFIAARFTSAGVLDPTFDGDGIARVAFDLGGGDLVYDDVFAMALDRATGAVILAGSAQTLNTTDLAIVRLTSSGQPDTSFSGDGKVNNNFGFAAIRLNALLLDGLGRITVAGRAEPFSGSGGRDFIAARFTPAGSVDTSFSGNGWMKVGFDAGPATYVADEARAATLDAGRLVLAGTAELDTDFRTGIALARLEIALIFADGLERGNVLAWSDASGSGP